MTSVYLMQIYSQPQASGLQRPSYVALRDELIKPLKNEFSKNEDRHLMQVAQTGVKAYVKTLFSWLCK
jgi:hypothetical protein